MKVKVYKVSPKNLPPQDADRFWYYVDAPNKHIAKWCGANLYNHDYVAFMSAKDMKAERFGYKEG